MKKLIAIITLALALSACNVNDRTARWLWNTPDAGVVHGHSHSDASVSCSGGSGGVPMTCTTTPESWSLDLYATNGDHGWTDVSEREFQRCEVGQQYPECGR